MHTYIHICIYIYIYIYRIYGIQRILQPFSTMDSNHTSRRLSSLFVPVAGNHMGTPLSSCTGMWRAIAFFNDMLVTWEIQSGRSLWRFLRIAACWAWLVSLFSCIATFYGTHLPRYPWGRFAGCLWQPCGVTRMFVTKHIKAAPGESIHVCLW